MKKSKAIKVVEELPDEFDLEDLIEKLIFGEKVEQGLQQVKEGKTVPHAEVKERIKKWQR